MVEQEMAQPQANQTIHIGLQTRLAARVWRKEFDNHKQVYMFSHETEESKSRTSRSEIFERMVSLLFYSYITRLNMINIFFHLQFDWLPMLEHNEQIRIRSRVEIRPYQCRHIVNRLQRLRVHKSRIRIHWHELWRSVSVSQWNLREAKSEI